MNYNDLTLSSVETCTSQGSSYCLEWTTEKVITFNIFDFFVLISLPFIVFWLIKLFSNRRRKIRR